MGQVNFHLVQQRVDRVGLNMMWRIPVKPLVACMFGDNNRDIGIGKTGKKYDQLLLSGFELIFLGRDRVLVHEPELFVDLNLVLADPRLFFQFAQRTFKFCFARVNMPLWQIPPCQMPHQQKGLVLVAEDQETAGSNLGHVAAGNYR